MKWVYYLSISLRLDLDSLSNLSNYICQMCRYMRGWPTVLGGISPIIIHINAHKMAGPSIVKLFKVKYRTNSDVDSCSVWDNNVDKSLTFVTSHTNLLWQWCRCEGQERCLTGSTNDCLLPDPWLASIFRATFHFTSFYSCVGYKIKTRINSSNTRRSTLSGFQSPRIYRDFYQDFTWI